MKDKKQSITLSLPSILIEDISKTAKKIGVSRSQLTLDLINLGVRAVESDMTDKVLEAYRRLNRDD